MEEISLKELIDKTLSLSQDEWEELGEPTRKKILKLIDPGNIVGVNRKRAKVTMTEKGKQVILDFIRMPKEEIAELKPYIRERLMAKTTELAEAMKKR